MQDLLFLAHRIPYPPDKGEKIRAFNVLKHLSATYRIHLGCLFVDAEEEAHLPSLREWCTTVAGFPLDRRWQTINALLRARPGRPLMLDYYRHPGLLHWVKETLARTRSDIHYIYSVAMMPYLSGLRRPGTILDAIDIDSEKWRTYATGARFPMRAVWAREGRTLLAYERQAAMQSDAVLFVSPQECARFIELAPETASRVHAVENGVDLQRFSPTSRYDTPFHTPGPHLVFTGHMDYWPNADAVAWFTAEVMPALRGACPGIELHIVGANPGPETLRLADLPGVSVTGRVPDVRPYVAHANVCLAPLRIARGIQNKVLESMAMGRPVIASPQAFEGVRAIAGQDLLVAEGAAGMKAAILDVLGGGHPGLGQAGRRAVEANYAWSATLAQLDNILQPTPAIVGMSVP